VQGSGARPLSHTGQRTILGTREEHRRLVVGHERSVKSINLVAVRKDLPGGVERPLHRISAWAHKNGPYVSHGGHCGCVSGYGRVRCGKY
jgi:hypothetical protein